MFLNIRYIMTRRDHSHLNSIAFERFYAYYDDDAFADAQVAAYRNKYWLPVAFMVSPSINYANLGQRNPFIVQNDIMRMATGVRGDIFRSISWSYDANVNVNVTPSGDGFYNYSVINTGSVGTVNKRFAVTGEDQQVYLYLRNPWHGGNKNATVRVYAPNGVQIGANIIAEADSGVTIDCGIVPSGGEIEISFEVHAGSANFNLYAATFDVELFEQGFDILSESTLQVSEFSATSIKGSITVYEDGLFFASIPFDPGWRIRVNGVERRVNPLTEIERRNVALAYERGERLEREDPRVVRTFRDGFITIPLEAGTHEIELFYVTDGLWHGVIISLISVVLIVQWEIIARIYKHKKIKRESEAEKELEREEIYEL